MMKHMKAEDSMDMEWKAHLVAKKKQRGRPAAPAGGGGRQDQHQNMVSLLMDIKEVRFGVPFFRSSGAPLGLCFSFRPSGFMIFDLRGQMRPRRPKRKFQIQ